MRLIKKTQVFKSQIHQNQKNCPGFAIIVEPHPTTEHEIFQIAQAIKDALDGLTLEEV